MTEKAKNRANPVHDRVVPVHLHADSALGKYFTCLGHIPLRRREDHLQGWTGPAERLPWPNGVDQAMSNHVRNPSSIT